MWKEVDILNVVPLQQYFVMLLFLLFFFFNFVTQFQEKIEIKHPKTLICFHLFIYFSCIAVFYSTVCQSRHHVVSRSWVLTSIESSLSRIYPDFYTQKSDGISQSKRRRKNDIQIKIITQLFKRNFHLINLYLFIHVFALHVLYSRTGC